MRRRKRIEIGKAWFLKAKKTFNIQHPSVRRMILPPNPGKPTYRATGSSAMQAV
jgi:hypothetical protein